MYNGVLILVSQGKITESEYYGVSGSPCVTLSQSARLPLSMYAARSTICDVDAVGELALDSLMTLTIPVACYAPPIIYCLLKPTSSSSALLRSWENGLTLGNLSLLSCRRTKATASLSVFSVCTRHYICEGALDCAVGVSHPFASCSEESE